MKIADAAIAMQSEHFAATRNQERETLRAWIGAVRPDFEGQRAAGNPMPPPAPPVQISSAGKSAQAAEAQAMQQAGDPADNDPFVAMLKAIVEWITGKPVKIFDASELQANAPPAPPTPPAPPSGEAAAAQPRRAGYGVEYEYHAVREEIEKTTFAAQGVIRTADGQEIAFRLDLAMTRAYREETNVSVRAGDAVRKDPLVINFGGAAAQLSSQRFQFDFDSDGKAEDAPTLKDGSGFLAIDLNHNGKIDSGAELFGPASGSGFEDLAKYDQDGNRWIDENDAVFDDLLVWTPAAEGDGDLATLQERNVGALYLGRVETPFELRGPNNQDLGAIRDTGVYLTESGEAGTLQEIDVTV